MKCPSSAMVDMKRLSSDVNPATQVTMVLLLDGSSEHSVDIWSKSSILKAFGYI